MSGNFTSMSGNLSKGHGCKVTAIRTESLPVTSIVGSGALELIGYPDSRMKDSDLRVIINNHHN